MPDFGIFRGFNEKLFGDKLYAGQLPTQLGLIGSDQVSNLLLYNYPNAAAAYSLRLLSPTYTGDAIEVRRASDNTTQDIGFVNNELDVTTLESFCSGTDGYVATWYDQSGNGNDATQSSASAQPQIVSSGSVITENGKPAVQIDGTNDYFSTSLNVGNIDSASYFTVTSLDVSASGFNAIIEGRIANDDGIGLAYLGTTNVRFHVDTDDRLISITPSQYVISSIYENSTSTLYVNSTNSNTGSAPSSINITFNYILLNSFSLAGPLKGNAQEIIIYNSDESSNRTGIETNINDFYSIY